ncbi:dual specificity protein phosphatase family protein [Rossellomorea aquimaris]|uniref:protein-tyrosine phosphatase family protein n=1 Tax=Rossellomorea aquimaris TaxID=189382 RepID=UPI0011E9643D|nr:dual specificity protein phosphatase family protein [Rossellomorea aquimaris]TYS91345.1 protein tyrosine phosphatase [Rossellomorea aquimaris]
MNYNELVKDRIYIGGFEDVDSVRDKVDIIVDLRAEAPGVEFDDVSRMHRPIVENADQQEESIRHAIDEVVTAYQNGKNIYFHCNGGSNRTGTVAAGTLLSLGEASTLEEAETKAKNVRPKINIKPELKNVLKELYPKN